MIRSFGDDDDGVPVFEAVNKDFALASFQASHRDNAMQWDVSSDLTHRAAIHNSSQSILLHIDLLISFTLLLDLHHCEQSIPLSSAPRGTHSNRSAAVSNKIACHKINMPVSFAFSSLDLHFWKKPSSRKTNSELETTQNYRQTDPTRFSVSHSIHRSAPSSTAQQQQQQQQQEQQQQQQTVSTSTTTRTERVHSIQKDSYFWDHGSACACQLCRRKWVGSRS
ncbi:hypothetical protein RB195_007124 [Necator americanus]|uniref:Uncharacterized protein n=2 Tax=Necator americanus TaxID=51031 RepID=A0ABR1BYL4_NECAM